MLLGLQLFKCFIPMKSVYPCEIWALGWQCEIHILQISPLVLMSRSASKSIQHDHSVNEEPLNASHCMCQTPLWLFWLVARLFRLGPSPLNKLFKSVHMFVSFCNICPPFTVHLHIKNMNCFSYNLLQKQSQMSSLYKYSTALITWGTLGQNLNKQAPVT